MNNVIFPLIVTAALLLVLACGTPGVKNGNSPLSTSNPSPSYPANGKYDGRGKITKINENLPSIELDHEAIAGLMPAMRMEFYAKDKALLDGLKVGDAVDFVLEYKHPAETIVAIKKIQ